MKNIQDIRGIRDIKKFKLGGHWVEFFLSFWYFLMICISVSCVLNCFVTCDFMSFCHICFLRYWVL